MYPEVEKRVWQRIALLAVVYSPMHGLAADMAVSGGVNAGVSYDDNVQVAAINKVSLAGMEAGGFVELQYDTPRLTTDTKLKVGADRYLHADFDSNNPQLKKPKASDFDSESYIFTTDLSYHWERYTLGIYGLNSSESNLNTQFEDGLGGLREIEGASQVDTSILRPYGSWNLTERQRIDVNLHTQFTDYQSDLYVNYDYYSVQSTWYYSLTERLDLQVRPLASRYENAAEFSITSDTYGLETGIVWAVTEKWELNILGGVTAITTDYDPDSYLVFNPVTGQIELIELEQDTSNGFTGDAALTFTEERYGFSAHLDSGFSPSSNGYLQESNSARFTAHWKARERLRVDFDGRVGMTDTTGDQLENKRTYGEAAVRVGWQFAEEWWLSARYRYREQDYERNPSGSANGNQITADVSYRLPKEVL